METFLLERGNTRVTVAPHAGGRMAQCAIFDGRSWLPLLHSGDNIIAMDASDPLSWGCFAMVPWPNRIARGRFRFEAQRYALPANDAAGANHGLGFARPWKVEWKTAAAIGMSLPLADAGWPWPARALQRIEVADSGVLLSMEITASAGVRFPAGCGWHPWFRRTLRAGDSLQLLVDADRRLELFEALPTGRTFPVEGAYDLRGFPHIGDRRLDDCYASVRGPLRLRWGNVELTMRLSPNLTYAVVYTRDHAVCVEPQTCAVDAFNLDARGIASGTAVVDAGRPLHAAVSWRWSIDA